MNTLENIKSRRSIRKFTDRQISEEELNRILEAGIWSPTGRNSQSPKFVVIQNKELINEISKINAGIWGKATDAFFGAPTLIVVFADSDAPCFVEDGSVALSSMMLEVNELGLGGCWIHRARQVFQTEQGKKWMREWGLSENYVGIGNLIVGHIDGEVPPAKPRKEDYVIRVK